MTAHVVCRCCLARWESATQPRYCITEGCDAGWLDLPMFVDLADADRAAARAAARFEEERGQPREAIFS